MSCKGCAYAVLLSGAWCCDYLNVTGDCRRCAERKEYICCADCKQRALCLAACRNGPARCGLEDKKSRQTDRKPEAHASGS